MGSSLDTVVDEVRRFLVQNAAGRATQVAALALDEVIWGVVDSLLVLDLVVYIERRFNLTVPPGDLIPDNFLTIGDIARYVKERGRS